MIPALLLALAVLLAGAGITMMARLPREFGPADAPAVYRRRILGAMLVGTSLFLGGFTLAASIPLS
ncbi:MAG TPA: hypothetical protein VF650_04730 [Allosphingosinicella sp.]|jgi:hypothetical protein